MLDDSDRRVIDRVRQTVRRRKTLGALMLSIGLACLSGIAFQVHTLRVQWLEIDGDIARSSPTTQRLSHLADEAQFTMGYAMGFLTAAGGAAALELALAGLIWIALRDRKDRLLLKCYDACVSAPEQRAISDET